MAVAQQVTGGQGSFALTVPPGTYSVALSGAVGDPTNYSIVVPNVDLSNGQQGVFTLPTEQVTVDVTNQNGNPVVGAQLQFSCTNTSFALLGGLASGVECAQETTGQNGVAILELLPTTAASLLITPPSGASLEPQTITVAPYDGQVVNVTLLPDVVTISVSGSQIYGSSSPGFTETNNAPSGLTLTGSLVCTTVNGGTQVSANLAAGSYTVDGSSCSGLSLSDPVGYTISYVGSAGAFVVIKAPQVMSFAAPPSGTVGGSATLSATGGGSGNPIVFSVDGSSTAGACNVSGTNGTTLNYTAVGSCVVDANQAGNSDYLAAPDVSQTILVGPATVTVNVSGSQTYGSSRPSFTQTNNAPAAVSISGTLACTTVDSGTAISATLGAGSHTVDGSSCFGLSLSDPVDYTLSYAGSAGGFMVSQAPQAITWTPPTSGTVGTSTTLSATGGASGNPVVFTVDSSSGTSVCKVSGTNGTTLNYTATGSCVVDANQAGNADYSAAPQVKATVPVSAARKSQTITFAALSNKTLAQSPVTVSATASSGLAVSFTTTTPSVCTSGGANGATITLVATGTCTVQASQAGNATYNPATPVSRSFTVSKASQTITFAALSNKTLAQSPVTVSATASSGLAVSFTTTTPSVCTSGGANGATITLVATGTCTVQASQAGNATYNPATPVSRNFTVSRS
jgi:hypothetical protein